MTCICYGTVSSRKTGDHTQGLAGPHEADAGEGARGGGGGTLHRPGRAYREYQHRSGMATDARGPTGTFVSYLSDDTYCLGCQ